MPSGYPAAIDNFNNPTAVDNLSDAPVLHHSQHTNVNDAVKAIEQELGITPKGAELSVADRLTAIELDLAQKLDDSTYHAAFGVATLDGASKLVEEVDAGKMTSGVLNIARIPNISGAKVLGTGSGGAAVPLDAVPNLPASRTTSGQFASAQIPPLDAAKITTGIMDRARLPTNMGATTLVKADIAGRDAVAIADRVDGLMVFVRSPNSLWMWRDEIDKWQLLSQKVALAGDFNTNTTATYTDLTGFSFNAQAGVTYGIDVTLFMLSGSSAPDIRYGFSWTGSGTMHFGHNGPDTGINAAASSGWTAAAIYGDGASPADHTAGIGLFAGSPMLGTVRATFVCTGDGVVQMRHSQMTAGAVVSTTRAGSRMKVESY